MKISNLTLGSIPWPGRPEMSCLDYKIGRIQLAKHLDVQDSIGSLSVHRRYAKQLLLKEKSEFLSGRVPLYVCSCCADLACGAVTVKIETTAEGILWSNFGWEGPDKIGISQSGYLAGTGPFLFDEEQYRYVLSTWE